MEGPTLQSSTDGVVVSLAWSPDGKLLASASGYRTIHVWSVDNGRELDVLGGHTDDINSVAWSSDSKHLASASDARPQMIELCAYGMWQTAARNCIVCGVTNWVISVAWSPLDSGHLASASDDKTVRVWSFADGCGKELYVMRDHIDYFNSVAWSFDSRHLASASEDMVVRVWFMANSNERGKELYALRGHTASVTSVAWSPFDSSQLASASDDMTVRVWSIADGCGKELYVLQGHTKSVYSVAWSQFNSKQLASCSVDMTVRVWSLANGKELHVLQGHTASVRSVHWSPLNKNKQLASGSYDGTIRMWMMGGWSDRTHHLYRDCEFRQRVFTVMCCILMMRGGCNPELLDLPELPIEIWLLILQHLACL